jgi:hypothetical protein
MLKAILPALAVTIHLLGHDAAAQTRRIQGPACAAAGPPSTRSLPIAPGEYRLTVWDSTRTGAPRVAGTLRLVPTRADDRSPRTRERAAAPRGDATPLYGYTQIDWRAVRAPMLPDSVDPPPESRDPVYPGVLVHAGRGEVTLTVGTVSNLRTGAALLDGAGIGLHVRRASGGSFGGSWRGWGVVERGAGWFCAERVPPGG